MESDMTVAENRTDERTDRVMREWGGSLTTWEMGTTSGRTHIDPGICFHPVCVTSQTQYACTISMANCKTKNTATPGGKELAQHRKDARGGILVHCRILLCNCQGVILTTVNTMETLAPLINDKFNIPVGYE